MQVFNAETMIRNTIDIISQTFPDYTIERTGSANVPVCADEIRLEQVLINFLNNAVKYSPNSKKIEVITDIKDSRFLFIGVRDFGIGISQEDQHNIFHKYYRTENSSNNFQGLGIGLYICSEILQRHNFEFGVESELGIGSLFYMLIPLNTQSSNGQQHLIQ
jgi:signal transduction histidine kinase